jgi:mRNA-degrading endonuclease YafQ of YafQ-DinJ toxin-antitoxin module
MVRILFSARFTRRFGKLSEVAQDLADEKTQIFRFDPFDARLKAHKLHGKLDGYWAFSVDYRTRILFEFIADDTAIFHSIGYHKIYD